MRRTRQRRDSVYQIKAKNVAMAMEILPSKSSVCVSWEFKNTVQRKEAEIHTCLAEWVEVRRWPSIK